MGVFEVPISEAEGDNIVAEEVLVGETIAVDKVLVGETEGESGFPEAV